MSPATPPKGTAARNVPAFDANAVERVRRLIARRGAIPFLELAALASDIRDADLESIVQRLQAESRVDVLNSDDVYKRILVAK